MNEILDPTYDAVMEAFDLQGDVLNPHGFRAAIREEVSTSVSRVIAAPTEFGPRAQMVQKLALRDAKTHAIIQSISLSQKWQTAQTLEDLFRRNPAFSLRILLIHPYSKNSLARETDLGFASGTIRQLVQESLIPLASLRNQEAIGQRLQVRGYWSMPYFGISSVDSVRSLITLSREGRGGDQNYACLIHGSTPSTLAMIADLEQGFEERWMASHDLMVPLELTVKSVASQVAGDTELKVAVESKSDVLAKSLVFKVDNGKVQEVAQSDPRRVLVSVLPISGGVVRVQVTEALSHDKNQWLASPVELSITGGGG
ncbi:hypothetical protein [Terrabacter sp. Root181]|uniref:hypothetical protein n=1 Tax=Terrabacter sp. Root181 TaxID=1736484 RepID=UPI0012FC14C5|nr:hypothetical protein [Terrabacter sp. Root181]